DQAVDARRASRSNGTKNGDLAPGQKPLALSPANPRRFRVFLGSSVGWPESNDFGRADVVPGLRQPRSQGFSEGSSDLAPLLREPRVGGQVRGCDGWGRGVGGDRGEGEVVQGEIVSPSRGIPIDDLKRGVSGG